MGTVKKNASILIAILSLLLLIFDARGVVAGAQEGVQLCIQTLVPSLFPFFVISGYFCNVCAAMRLPILKPLLRLCKMPDGADALFVIGMLGGYPVGAKSIADAYRNKQIDSENALRMLGFCSNAGPAFVFGIVGTYFKAPYIPWIVFGILILSALLTGYLLPKTDCSCYIPQKQQPPNFVKLFQSSLVAIASVCGWVILFRVFITILERWIFWAFPETLQIALTGILELSNGCIAINLISNDGMRFIVSTGLLSFGGLCVYLQTVSVVGNLGTGLYFPGKILQCTLALTISGLMQCLLFPIENRIPVTVTIIPVILLICILISIKIRNCKKTVAIPQELIYNTEN